MRPITRATRTNLSMDKAQLHGRIGLGINAVLIYIYIYICTPQQKYAARTIIPHTTNAVLRVFS